MSAEHRLRLRCPTWGHLENFYQSKIRDGNVLLARVPFAPSIGSRVVVALQIPDGIVIEIKALVEGVRQAPDGKKSAIRMILEDMQTVRPRLKQAVREGRKNSQGEATGTVSEPQSVSIASALPRTKTGLLVPIPSDVPIDEPVESTALPHAEEVESGIRALYRGLEKSLTVMREKAAHDVLGVAWDAEVRDIRLAYFVLVKQYHPDVLGRHGSEAVSLLGSEIFIYINKAYDRLRDSAVAAGKAIAAGPALLPSSGWIAEFDDIGSVQPHARHLVSDLAAPIPEPIKAMSSLAMNAPARDASVEVRFSSSVGAEKSGASASAASGSPESNSAASGSPESNSAASVSADTASAAFSNVESVSPESKGELEDEALFADARTTGSGMRPLGENAPSSQNPSEQREGEELRLSVLLDHAYDSMVDRAYGDARETLAKFLELRPRHREARALYHVAYGHTLIERGKETAAMTQFEVALKHDPNCQLAADARSGRRAGRSRRSSILQRLFRR